MDCCILLSMIWIRSGLSWEVGLDPQHCLTVHRKSSKFFKPGRSSLQQIFYTENRLSRTDFCFSGYQEAAETWTPAIATCSTPSQVLLTARTSTTIPPCYITANQLEVKQDTGVALVWTNSSSTQPLLSTGHGSETHSSGPRPNDPSHCSGTVRQRPPLLSTGHPRGTVPLSGAKGPNDPSHSSGTVRQRPPLLSAGHPRGTPPLSGAKGPNDPCHSSGTVRQRPPLLSTGHPRGTLPLSGAKIPRTVPVRGPGLLIGTGRPQEIQKPRQAMVIQSVPSAINRKLKALQI